MPQRGRNGLASPAPAGRVSRRNGAASPASAAFAKSIPYLLGAISNLLSIGGSRLYRRSFKLGLMEIRLMWVLGVEPRITAQAASQIIGVDKAAISRALATLERRRLVDIAADPADSRQRIIDLSPQGRRLHQRILRVSRERERRLLAPFTQAESRLLASLLHRMHGHAASVNAFDPAALLATMEDAREAPEPKARPTAPR